MQTPITSFSGKHRFLSNFWPAPVELDGKWYPTVEHAYVAAKTIDLQDRENIRHIYSPGQAKRYGKNLVLREGWNDLRLGAMEDLCTKKFTLLEECRVSLLMTGTAELVEGNNWGDTFWGMSNGVGCNHLGVILMRVRNSLC